MRKALSVIVTVFVLLILIACGKSEMVKAAETAIDDIGSVTLESEDAIKTAESIFESLTDQEKEQVNNHNILVEAQNKYAEMVEEQRILLEEQKRQEELIAAEDAKRKAEEEAAKQAEAERKAEEEAAKQAEIEEKAHEAEPELAYQAVKDVLAKYRLTEFVYSFEMSSFVCSDFEKLSSKDKWKLMKELTELWVYNPISDRNFQPIEMPDFYIHEGDTCWYYYVSWSTYSAARFALSMAGGNPNQALYPGVYYREETKDGKLLNTTLIYREEG